MTPRATTGALSSASEDSDSRPTSHDCDIGDCSCTVRTAGLDSTCSVACCVFGLGVAGVCVFGACSCSRSFDSLDCHLSNCYTTACCVLCGAVHLINTALPAWSPSTRVTAPHSSHTTFAHSRSLFTLLFNT